MGAERLPRQVMEELAGFRLELIAPGDGQPRFIIRHRPVWLFKRHLAEIRRDRRQDDRRPLSGSRLRPLVPQERREKRPRVLLARIPDAGVANKRRQLI